MKHPAFVKNDVYYNLDTSQDKLVRLVALAENIKRVHLLTAKHYDSFETLIAEYLKSGIEIFQMQTGIVSHITDQKKYIVKDVVTDLDVIHPGDEYELEGTYCKEVYATQRTISFPCVADIKELKDHPVYVNLRLEAYLSSPIFVNDKLYGTLNFTSVSPRKHGFSEHEHDLISMMASAIGNFILLQQKEENLTKLNFRMRELVGHVAHDLRGPLGGINGLCKMILSRNANERSMTEALTLIDEESHRCLELVNVILEQAALGTGKVSLEKTHFKILPLLQKSLKGYALLIDEKELIINTSVNADIQLYADKARIEQVLNNLLVNAFKYAKKGSEIEIAFVSKEGHVRCSIYNLNGQNQETLQESVYKSVGYGLDIVSEILQLHDSRLEVSKTDISYCVAFDLPLQQ